MSKHIIVGSPGTGKTFSLLIELEKLFNQGYSPEDITFCTFTRAGAEEAKIRVSNKFNIEKKNLKYFGTIHSICFKRFCFGKKVMSGKKTLEFFNKIGLSYIKQETDEDLLTNEKTFNEDGNCLINFYDKLRIQFCRNIFKIQDQKELKELFHSFSLSDDYYEKIFSNSFNPYEILIKYENYKEQEGYIDFIDMLLNAYNEKFNVPTKVLIVDEFQDLSPLQFEIYKQWSRGKEEVYLAGDDDQTIYRFICANPEHLLSEIESLDIEKGDEKRVLNKTYRMCAKINSYCHNYIQKYIKGKRENKVVEHIKEGGEIIEDYVDGDLNKVFDYINKDNFTFVLFRTNYYKRLFIDEILIPSGIIYHEIRGQSIWNSRTINLFNACYKLVNKRFLNYDEVDYLIKNIPFKYGLLKRGLKSNFKDLQRKEKYSLSDLLEIGFDMKIFKILNYDQLFSILNLNEKVVMAFNNTSKEIKELPIKLKIGTIHSCKGKEASDVILFKDVNYRVANEMSNENCWDDEIRLFYVGASRARNKLVLLRGGFERSEADVIP